MQTNEAGDATARYAASAGLTVCLITVGLYSVWIGSRFGFDAPPSSTGDELSYDSVAWELSHGRGFSVNYADPDFRQPYDLAAATSPDLYSIPDTTSGPIAFRPPLFPVVFSMANRITGRHFYLIRAFNVLCMAATAGLIGWFVYRESGVWPLAVVVLLFWADTRSRLYARTVLTEPLACFLCAVMTLLVIRLSRESGLKRRTVAALSVVTALSILTRSVVIVWLPGLLVMLWCLIRRQHQQSCRQALSHCGLFLLLTVLCVSPWAIRNIRLLGKFAPMGTQGQMEMSAGYSDIAWEHGGVWQNLASRNYFAAVVHDDMTTIDAELATAEKSTADAVAWIRANPAKLPALAVMKVASELRPASFVEWLVAALALIGVWLGRDRKLVAVLVVLIVVNLSAVAATWSVEGRFLVPQLFVFYALAGIGFECFVLKGRAAFDRTTADVAAEQQGTPRRVADDS